MNMLQESIVDSVVEFHQRLNTLQEAPESSVSSGDESGVSSGQTHDIWTLVLPPKAHPAAKSPACKGGGKTTSASKAKVQTKFRLTSNVCSTKRVPTRRSTLCKACYWQKCFTSGGKSSGNCKRGHQKRQASSLGTGNTNRGCDRQLFGSCNRQSWLR